MKNNKLPGLISILVLTLITTIMWISLSIYRAFTTQPTPSVKKEISEPLTPTLDKSAIDSVEASLFLDSSQIPQNVVTQISTNAKVNPTAVPTTNPLPTSTPEATASSTPVPTP